MDAFINDQTQTVRNSLKVLERIIEVGYIVINTKHRNIPQCADVSDQKDNPFVPATRTD